MKSGAIWAMFRVLAFTLCLVEAVCLPEFSAVALGLEFLPNETQVSSQHDLIDPEYDQTGSQFTWVDSKGRLWIGKLDSSGMFEPSSGKAVLVDAYALDTNDLVNITMNGPEWLQTSEGPKIVYTRFLPYRPHTAETARIAIAEMDPAGAWVHTTLSPRYAFSAPYGSSDMDDPAPRITYMDTSHNHDWRQINNYTMQGRIPLIAPSRRPVRWVEGSHSVIFVAKSPIDGTSQVFSYDVDTKALEQMTFDKGYKNTTSPWMWPAPEYNDEYIFFVNIYDANSRSSVIRIYRRIDANNDGRLEWTKIYSIVAPLARIGSPEPFVYNGHSYIFMQLTINGYDYPTSIWLANIDPANPFFRQISDDTLLRARTDPEVFITGDGPYIYYNRKDPADPTCSDLYCTEGIFRAYTGIPLL
ncbi:MAG: hypothetical protein GXP58_05410 [Deltaproteobacteria bacterium]|nr:hypothetical protein [Deltaproteobacteria bacterium]